MSAVECKISIDKGYRHGCSCLFRAFCVRCVSLVFFKMSCDNVGCKNVKNIPHVLTWRNLVKEPAELVKIE